MKNDGELIAYYPICVINDLKRYTAVYTCIIVCVAPAAHELLRLRNVTVPFDIRRNITFVLHVVIYSKLEINLVAVLFVIASRKKTLTDFYNFTPRNCIDKHNLKVEFIPLKSK